MTPPDERIIGDDFPLLEGSFLGRTAPPEPRIGAAKVPPRGGGVSSRKLAYYFFLDERLHIAKDGHQRDTRGPTRQGHTQGGRARPHPRGRWVAPVWYFFLPIFLYILEIIPMEFQDFSRCAE